LHVEFNGNLQCKNCCGTWLGLLHVSIMLYELNHHLQYGECFAIRYVFRQDLLCQHSSKNKTKSQGVTSRSTDCPAFVSVKIKHVNRHTRKNDSFLRRACICICYTVKLLIDFWKLGLIYKPGATLKSIKASWYYIDEMKTSSRCDSVRSAVPAIGTLY